jgi:hypothetical protein
VEFVLVCELELPDTGWLELVEPADVEVDPCEDEPDDGGWLCIVEPD